MNSKDFAYWLQGYFELRTDSTSILTETQIKIIKQHLELVKVTDKKLQGFCAWLNTIFELLDTLKLSFNVSFNEELMKILSIKLNEEFKHVIDPTYSAQEVLNKIHSFRDKDSDHPGSMIRC